MGFTNGPGAPPDAGTGSRSPSTGALVASMAAAAVLVVADAHLPYLAGWALNTAAVLGASAAVCRHKRSRPAWACAGVLAVICAADPFLALAGLMDGARSGVYWTVCAALTGAWYWLLKFPAVRPAPAPEPQVVIHRHVIDGAQSPAAVPAPAAPVTVPGSVVRPAIASVGARRHLTRTATVLQRLGRER